MTRLGQRQSTIARRIAAIEAERAAKAAEMMPVQAQATTWFPVSKPPECDTEVLLYSPDADCYYLAYRDDEGEWTDDIKPLPVGRHWTWTHRPTAPRREAKR